MRTPKLVDGFTEIAGGLGTPKLEDWCLKGWQFCEGLCP